MRKTVLIVDDDPAARRMLEHHLTRDGFDVIVAENGREAIRIIVDSEPAMVVTDLEMPEMSGLEVCRHIRTFGGLDWVYTIVLTASDDRERMLEAFEAGADDYLTKPFNRRELLARLRAGERIVNLERTLARKSEEIARSKADLERAYTRLAAANERLHHMAQSDELTGLPNRRAAMAALTRLWREARDRDVPLACLMLDVDHFKLVNDTHGHDAGDRVLMAVAHAIRDATRRSEEVFRLGGEEFLVLCPGATAAMAGIAGERLRAAVEAIDVAHGSGELRVTASVGVAERAPEMGTEDHLVKAADDALYDAKDAGRNCVRVAPTSPHAMPRRDDERGRATA